MKGARGFQVVSAFEGKGLHLPQRKTGASAGYDIEAAEDALLLPRGMTLVATGLKAYMQQDEVLYLYIRSGLSVRHQLMLMNNVGVIDADYYDNPENEGHIMVSFWNLGTEPFQVEKGMRIAQGVFMKYLTADADAAGMGEERLGGFGSTGL
ncbi:MAG: dUTP diphosphatase [Selenomonadaceae bacterium]|nr:dUTP diphosphatase [Selenomonadaceae bacterium]